MEKFTITITKTAEIAVEAVDIFEASMLDITPFIADIKDESEWEISSVISTNISNS